ncbi:unnamed protein product [Rotaria magnacalcarata]|uniref:EF-hand domain-containing protein n=3 Tax=Rotaria magnacalcarata TaxID=392030 RepID=A0A816NNR1_9BILA|nr:unnamed protein product [Rotaria magnacalcarata]CAF1598246.1 unnamed protein product [Rotaria magnacalcarata]CAF2037102.1 unnamed protein product [Rotaria magnacalcarata]CAF2070481.1 unnamed protein product [Rotaria magnacalcarata]CAF2191888.1 unnamed protein product [Rotaria magnacalcarata]
MGNKQPKTSSTELTDKQIALLKANTQYSEEEIRQWHAGFIRDCPSGRLDKKRFVDVYRQFYPSGKPDNYCKYAFTTFDTNHDGSVDFSEFLLAMTATSKGDLDDRLTVAFEMYDISNDGLIDLKELTMLLTAMYDLVGETDRTGDRDPKKRAAIIIQKLDVSGDKKLSKAEFIAGCKNDAVIRKLLAPNS